MADLSWLVKVIESFDSINGALPMSTCQAVPSAASSLPLTERLQLIDDLASGVPDDQPPRLPDSWLQEISRRSDEIDSGIVESEDWLDVKTRLFSKHVDNAS